MWAVRGVNLFTEVACWKLETPGASRPAALQLVGASLAGELQCSRVINHTIFSLLNDNSKAPIFTKGLSNSNNWRQSAVQKHVRVISIKNLYNQYFFKMGGGNLRDKMYFERFSFDIGYGWFWAFNLSPYGATRWHPGSPRVLRHLLTN